MIQVETTFGGGISTAVYPRRNIVRANGFFYTCFRKKDSKVREDREIMTLFNPPPVHPRVGGNYPRQISKIEAYRAEIFSDHGGAREGGIPPMV